MIGAQTETGVGTSQWWKVWENEAFPTVWVAGSVIAVLVVMLVVFTVLRVRGRKKDTGGRRFPTPSDKEKHGQGQQEPTGRIGKVHNIGGRKDQQDSFGVTRFAGGEFAVVADGMGGLSGGDKISQKVVMTMLYDVSGLGRTSYDQVLFEFVSHANREVNAVLGNPGQFTSGSTVVAAIVEEDRFHWVSVGDSRICLYRNKRLIQLNREHTYGAELLLQAVNGEVAFDEARSHPKRGGLTSFIGMGELRYVDGSSRGVQIQQGDRLLLMSDGVFHTLSEEELQQIMEISGCAEEAASVIQERVLGYRKANQDNFTAVIIDL